MHQSPIWARNICRSAIRVSHTKSRPFSRQHFSEESCHHSCWPITSASIKIMIFTTNNKLCGSGKASGMLYSPIIPWFSCLMSDLTLLCYFIYCPVGRSTLYHSFQYMTFHWPLSLSASSVLCASSASYIRRLLFPAQHTRRTGIAPFFNRFRCGACHGCHLSHLFPFSESVAIFIYLYKFVSRARPEAFIYIHTFWPV